MFFEEEFAHGCARSRGYQGMGDGRLIATCPALSLGMWSEHVWTDLDRDNRELFPIRPRRLYT